MKIAQWRAFIEGQIDSLRREVRDGLLEERKYREELEPIAKVMRIQRNAGYTAAHSGEDTVQLFLGYVAKSCPECISDTGLCSEHRILNSVAGELATAVRESLDPFYAQLEGLSEELTDEITRTADLEDKLQKIGKEVEKLEETLGDLRDRKKSR